MRAEGSRAAGQEGNKEGRELGNGVDMREGGWTGGQRVQEKAGVPESRARQCGRKQKAEGKG